MKKYVLAHLKERLNLKESLKIIYIAHILI